MVSETKIRPQTIWLKVATSELTPSYNGMLWLDSNDILRLDAVGTGNPNDFVTVLPEHTIGGQHGPKINITQTAADNALAIVKSGIAPAISVTCLTTDAGAGLSVVSNSAATAGVVITKSGTAYAEGLIVTQAGVGSGIRIYQQTPYDGLRVEKSATGGGTAIQVFNTGVGVGVDIEQRGDAPGLVINKGTGSNTAMIIVNSGGAAALDIEQNGIGTALLVNKTNTSNYVVVQIANAGTAASLQVDQNGAGSAFDINQNANGVVFDIDRTTTSNVPAVDVLVNGGQVLNLTQSNTSDSANVVSIVNSGTGTGLVITGPVRGLSVTSTSTIASHLVDLVNGGPSTALDITQNRAIPSNGVVVNITNTTSAGRGLQINQLGLTNPNSAILINNSGTGSDIYGSGGTWSISKTGGVLLGAGGGIQSSGAVSVNNNTSTNRLSLNYGGLLTATTISGAPTRTEITVTKAYHFVDDTAGALARINSAVAPATGQVIILAADASGLAIRGDVSQSNFINAAAAGWVNLNIGPLWTIAFVWNGSAWSPISVY